MRNIYDVFNNVKPIDVDEALLDEQEAHELVQRLNLRKKKRHKINLATACIAGIVLLTGGTVFAYSQGVFEDWLKQRNNSNVSEEYLDQALLTQDYSGSVNVQSVDTISDLDFEILRVNVTEKCVYVAMIVTYNNFDVDTYYDFDLQFNCPGFENGYSESTSNKEYENLQLKDNQRLISHIFCLDDTSSIINSGTLNITATNLYVSKLVDSDELPGEANLFATNELVDYGCWELTIPITEYSEVKYAIIPEGSDVCEIYVYNWGLHMTKKYWLDWGDYNHNAVKLITDDGEILEQIESGSGAYIDQKYSYHIWHFNVPIDIDKIKYVEIKGELFELEQ